MSARIVHIASNTFREAVRDRVLYNLIGFALLMSGASILVGLWTASCFITPGADPYSPLILGVAFTVLFFVSTALIRLVGRNSTLEAIQIIAPGVLTASGGAVGRRD